MSQSLVVYSEASSGADGPGGGGIGETVYTAVFLNTEVLSLSKLLSLSSHPTSPEDTQTHNTSSTTS